MFKFTAIRSIQVKITLWAGLCFLLAAAGIIAYAAVALRATALHDAQDSAVSSAQFEASKFKAEMDVVMDGSRTLAQSFGAIKANGSPITLTREQADGMLKQYLASNPQVLDVYTLWEPNAFDGKDADYANKPGTDASGRYIPTWSRGENNQMVVEPNYDYDKPGAGDYYLEPKQTLIERAGTMIYPIQGKDMVIANMIAPVVVDGKFYGIVGGDLDINHLQQLADDANVFDHSGMVLIIADSGMIMGSTNHANWNGKDITTVYPDWVTSGDRNTVLKGQQVVRFKENDLQVFVPLWIGNTSQPWTVNVNIPTSVILAQATTDMWRMIAIGAVLLVIALGLLWFAARQVALPIVHITDVAQAVTGGKLDVQAYVHAEDETGVLADAFNQMIKRLRDNLRAETEQREYLQDMVSRFINFMSEVGQNNLAVRLDLHQNSRAGHDPMLVLGKQLNAMVDSLQKMIVQIREGADNLNQASAEILAATTQQASGASEQSSAVAQTSTSVEEIKSITESAIARAHEVASAAQRNVEVYQAGQKALQETIDSMNQIRQRVESIAENILALSEQTQQIGEIISTVSEIASQSNMLALNASVEAARAGEHGKGFAVVAAEVRSLAEQSRQATTQVRAILSDIQKATNSTVMATEEGTKGVEDGLKRADLARESISQLANAINESAQIAVQLSAGGQQQKTGMDQIGLAMQNINQSTIQGLASTRQAEHSAQSLNELAQNMTEMVRQFRLN